MRHFIAALLAGTVLLAGPALADDPVVETAAATRTGDTWRFAVTLSHPDTGWDHYADGWEVLTPDGTRLGFRELLHPHVTEQPFTRSLGDVALPDGLDRVLIRPRCSVDGWAGASFTLLISR